jgi:ferredoxin-NADP reductase/nitrite reductase/ring-hydroxylating ferredoxin subunit
MRVTVYLYHGRNAMPRFASKLIERILVADGTMAFAFERPQGFDFLPGQYLTLTLPDPPHDDAKGSTRTFSIASPPDEEGRLVIATRMTGSALKRSLAEVPLVTSVSLFGPAGSFILPEETSRPLVFIAGGIGITPFRSMILHAVRRRLPHRITLVYSNRMPEGAAFHEELAALAEHAPAFRYLPSMTQAEDSAVPWHGERRFVSAELLTGCLDNLAGSTFYVAGPPGLVAVAGQAVLDAGVDPAYLITEEFGGYESKKTWPAGGAAPAPVQTPDSERDADVAAAAPPAAGEWVRVAGTGDLKPDQVKGVWAGGKRIALCNVGGEYYAVADECPHAGGALSEGDLLGKELTCPLHGAIFDVTTGAVLEQPADEPVPCYSVRVVGSDVEVKAVD